MSAVVILVLFETVRFLVKDKSENTFIEICLPRLQIPRHYKISKSFANDNTPVRSCSDKIRKHLSPQKKKARLHYEDGLCIYLAD